MRHRLIAVLAGVALLAVVGGCGGDSSDDSDSAATGATSTSTTVAPSSSTTATTTVAATTATVTVKGLEFVPTRVTIKVGGSVTFTNPEGFIHTVTPDVSGSFGGADRASFAKSGASYTAAFSRAGTFVFHCEIHGATGGSGMSGSVTVVP